MAILSNIDNKLDPLERRKAERAERRRAFIDERYARSAKAQKQQGVESAPRRFWFQEDAYSFDAKFDASVEAVKAMTTLPVKERVTLPDGTLQKTLGKAAAECVRLGIFCMNCEERQPEGTVAHRERLHSLERTGITLPPGASERDTCAYCAAPLGVQGEAREQTMADALDPHKDLVASLMAGQIRG